MFLVYFGGFPSDLALYLKETDWHQITMLSKSGPRFVFALTLSCMVAVATSRAVETLSQPSMVRTTFQNFCSGQQVAKRGTLAEIRYAGNTGLENNYGCNLMLVDDSIAHQYRYTINMTNSASTSQSCVCWLKVGPSGKVNGFTKGNQVLDFTLPLRGHRILATAEDTIGGCSCSQGAMKLSPNNLFGSTWLEFTLGPKFGLSAADASCIVAAQSGFDIAGLQVCSPETCSTVQPGGSGENAYLAGMEHLDGIGVTIPPGKVRLTAVFGYQG